MMQTNYMGPSRQERAQDDKSEVRCRVGMFRMTNQREGAERGCLGSNQNNVVRQAFPKKVPKNYFHAGTSTLFVL
jgi:hypothetical protein